MSEYICKVKERTIPINLKIRLEWNEEWGRYEEKMWLVLGKGEEISFQQPGTHVLGIVLQTMEAVKRIDQTTSEDNKN